MSWNVLFPLYRSKAANADNFSFLKERLDVHLVQSSLISSESRLTYQCCPSACSTCPTCSSATGPDERNCLIGGTASSNQWLWTPPGGCWPQWHRKGLLPWSCTSWLTLNTLRTDQTAQLGKAGIFSNFSAVDLYCKWRPLRSLILHFWQTILGNLVVYVYSRCIVYQWFLGTVLI